MKLSRYGTLPKNVLIVKAELYDGRRHYVYDNLDEDDVTCKLLAFHFIDKYMKNIEITNDNINRIYKEQHPSGTDKYFCDMITDQFWKMDLRDEIVEHIEFVGIYSGELARLTFEESLTVEEIEMRFSKIWE